MPAPSGMLPVPDVAEQMGTDVVHVRTLLKEGKLLGIRDEQGRLMIAAACLDGAEIVKHLVPVLTLLADAGYSTDEALTWLTTADESLPGTPLDALHENRATEVKRRAQAPGF